MFFFLHSYLPAPIAVNIGPIAVYWYGLILAAAMLAGYFVATRLARRGGLSPATVGSIYINLLFWGVIGARLYHVLNDWPFYWQNPIAIIKIWEGGLAIHGGIIAGAAALFYYARKYKNTMSSRASGASVAIPSETVGIASSADGHRLPRNDIWAGFLSLADIFSLPLVLGQALGRWGNYFNQELFGRPTNLPWGIPIAPANRPVGFTGAQYFHPTFLYEFLWDGLVFFILLWLSSKKRPAGTVLALYLILYGLGRIGVEFLRIDAVPLVGGVRLPLLVSAAIVVAGLMLLRRRILNTTQQCL